MEKRKHHLQGGQSRSKSNPIDNVSFIPAKRRQGRIVGPESPEHARGPSLLSRLCQVALFYDYSMQVRCCSQGDKICSLRWMYGGYWWMQWRLGLY